MAGGFEPVDGPTWRQHCHSVTTSASGCHFFHLPTACCYRPTPRSFWWCMKLWDITLLGSALDVGFFDVDACLHSEGPIAALAGGAS